MIINGKKYLIHNFNGNRIEDILNYFQIKKETVAIELNENILPKNLWEKTSLTEKDKLEIIKFVGGG